MGQALPQVPQLLVLVLRSTHELEQFVRLSDWQSALQEPLTHSQFAAQAVSQWPQWTLSLVVSTHTSPQRVVAPAQLAKQAPVPAQK
jgi:hypothetical protein